MYLSKTYLVLANLRQDSKIKSYQYKEYSLFMQVLTMLVGSEIIAVVQVYGDNLFEK